MSATGEITKHGLDRERVGLLPLSKDPFQAPTDRDMLPSERREFVRTHRTCVFGYGRQSDGPAMSIVYYIPADNDDLYVATMADRAKAKAVARNGKISLCSSTRPGRSPICRSIATRRSMTTTRP